MTATADDILCGAKEYIVKFGWERNAWPEHGPGPRCIRAALHAAAIKLDCEGHEVHGAAIRRVSGAIYGRGQVGGINDWEHKKAVNKDSVIAMLQKAIEMGPDERPTVRTRLEPV